MFKRIFECIFAVLAFVCEVLATTVLAAGIVLLGIMAIAFFFTGNIFHGIFAVLTIIGFILLLWQVIDSAW